MRPNTVPPSRLRFAVIASCLLALSTALVPLPAVAQEADLPALDGLSQATAAASCWEIKQNDQAALDGVYWLLTPELKAPQQFYCDMTTDGGGWVLIGRGREGWVTRYEGVGNPGQVHTPHTGQAAFQVRQLSSKTIDGLLNGERVDALADPIRLRRATNSDGTSWQEARFRYDTNLTPRDRWVWTFPAEHRVGAYAFDATTGSGGGTQTTANFGTNTSFNRVDTRATSAQGWTHGWAYGSNVSGTNSPSTYLWSASTGVGAARPFTQLYLRPRLLQADLGFAPIPNEGTPAIEQRPLPENRALASTWGVTGLANGRTGELNEEVQVFAQVGDRVFVGGNFLDVQLGQNPGGNIVRQSYLAAFDVDTGAWISTFRPTFNQQVKSLAALPSGKLAVGGEFTQVNGSTANAVVVLDPLTGATDPGFSIDVENRLSTGVLGVRAMAVQGDWLYIGGAFTHLSGGSQPNATYSRGAARVSIVDGTPDGNWNPNFDGTVSALSGSSDPGRVYAAGYFGTSNGDPALRVAALQTVPGAPLEPTTWAPEWSRPADRTNYQQAIQEVGDRIWVGGAEHSMFSFSPTTFNRLSGNITKAGGDFQAISSWEGVVFGSCHCIDWNYSNAFFWPGVGTNWTQADKIGWTGAWDATTGQVIPDFNPIMNARAGLGIWATFTDSTGVLWAGGDMISALRTGEVNQWVGGFARFAPRDTQAPTTPGQPSGAALDSSTLTFTWNASADDRGPVSYEVLRDDRVVATTTQTSVGVPTGATDSRYFVRAVDGAGNRSASTSALSPFVPPDESTVELIAEGSEWAWRFDTDPKPADWRTPGFDDASWPRGPAPLGFGATALQTNIDVDGPTSSRPLSALFRRSVEIVDPSDFTALQVTTLADDGIVVFVNGTEIGRANMPAGDLTLNSYATAAPSTTVARSNPVNFTASAGLLQPGTNTVSVQVHLNYRSTPNISFDLNLTALAGSADLDPPAAPVVSASLVGEDAVRLDWTHDVESDVVAYRVARDGQEIAFLPAPADTYLDEGLEPNTSYDYAVTAIDPSGDESTPGTVTVTTAGTPLTMLNPDPVALEFGEVITGTGSPQTVTLANSGDVAVDISTIEITGTDAAMFAVTGTAPTTVAAGGSATVEVTFTPTAAGARTATLQLTHNGTNTPLEIALTGTGVVELAPGVLNPDPVALEFGEVITGTGSPQTVTLANSGDVAVDISTIEITGTDAAMFAVTGTAPTTVAAGGSATVEVTFTPTAAGARTATLQLTHNGTNTPLEIALTGTGVVELAPGVLNPDPVALEFGEVITGTGSPQTVTLANSGDVAVDISTIEITGTDAAMFAVTGTAPTTVAAGGSATVEVTFTPTAAGARTATLQLTHNGTNTPLEIALTGTGVVELAPGVLNPDPVALEFGEVITGTGSPQTVTLANSGDVAVDISTIEITGTDAAMFAVTGTAPTTVAAGGSATVEVTFTPTAAGARTATLQLTHNGTNTPLEIALTGTGVVELAPGVLNPDPVALEFGEVITGTGSPQTVTLANSGDVAVDISTIEITGTDAAMFAVTGTAPTTVAAGGSATVEVTFTPTAAGARTATLQLTHNGTNTPLEIALTGTGVVELAPGVLNPDPVALEFGEVITGTGSPQTVTLANSGDVAVDISTIEITGTDAAMFAVTGTAPTTVAAGGSATVEVTFTPTAAGARTATLQLTHNGTNTPLEIALTGTGVVELAPGVLNPDPVALEFGEVITGTGSPQTVTLANSGDVAVDISTIEITGTDAAMFAVTGTAPTTVAAGGSATVEVTFTPTAAGARTATLQLTHNGTNTPLEIALTGTGVVELAPGVLNPDPVALEFGEVITGTGSPQTVTLANSGDVAVDISTIEITGTDAAMFAVTGTAPTTVAAGGSATVEVTFTPTAAGARTATLQLTHNGTNTPLEIALTGTGVVELAPGVLNPDPVALEFGEVITGTGSPQTVTLANSGDVAVDISTIEITGTDAAMFAVTGTAPTTVAAGGSATVEVTFTPTAAGARTATLQLTHNGTNTPLEIALTGTGVLPPLLRFEDDDERLVYSMEWTTALSPSYSGGSAAITETPGARAWFVFEGTEARWIGTRSRSGGIAEVFIDGTSFGTVDLYTQRGSGEFQAVVFEIDGLEPGSHVLEIVNTDRRHPRSSGFRIEIDAIEVVTLLDPEQAEDPTDPADPPPPPAPEPIRFEQDDLRIEYTGTWSTATDSRYSAGTAAITQAAGATARMTFEGTEVRWIGTRSRSGGIAEVRIDGISFGTVDLYTTRGSGEYQAVVFEVSGLESGDHVLEIINTGTRNQRSNGFQIEIDAIEAIALRDPVTAAMLAM
jgi:trimeric autotransporter adhesin